MKHLYNILAILFLGIFSLSNGFSQDQCYENLHTPFSDDAWLSCEAALNPNPERGMSHWIMYDLRYIYKLDTTQIWNYNAWGESQFGFKDVIIDYSTDGVVWNTAGTFEFPQASSSYKYQGSEGPDLTNIEARWIILTAQSNWGDAECFGFSEIKFNVQISSSSEPEPEIANEIFEVSPNPAKDIAQVSFKSNALPEFVGLYELSGRLLDSKSQVLSSDITFNIQNLPSGIYVVKARLDEQIYSSKLVKISY